MVKNTSAALSAIYRSLDARFDLEKSITALHTEQARQVEP